MAFGVEPTEILIKKRTMSRGQLGGKTPEAALRKSRILSSNEIPTKLSLTTLDEDGIDEGRVTETAAVDASLHDIRNPTVATAARRALEFIVRVK